MRKVGAAADTDHQKSIRERLKDIMDLFRLSRYRATPAGHISIDEDFLVRGGILSRNPRPTQIHSQHGGPGGPGGTAGNVYAVFEKADGALGARVMPDPFPVVRWVSVKGGTREYGDIEDRAAKFLPDQNLLLINAEFRVFTDMIARFGKEFSDVPEALQLVQDAVRAWFEQALVESVIGVQGLANSKEWTHADIDLALSEEALTSSVMQRYHVHFAVKRELGSKLGSRKAQVVG